MKMVSGTVVSSKTVSLSKTARILSKFDSSDNGASPAFAAYLKRASASFGELVQLHKEFKGSGSQHKRKKHLLSGIVNEKTVNFVRKPSVHGLMTEEKQGTSERKKHKRGKRGEGETRELEGCLKIHDENQMDNKKRREEGEGNADFLCGYGKKLKKKSKSMR